MIFNPVILAGIFYVYCTKKNAGLVTITTFLEVKRRKLGAKLKELMFIHNF